MVNGEGANTCRVDGECQNIVECMTDAQCLALGTGNACIQGKCAFQEQCKDTQELKDGKCVDKELVCESGKTKILSGCIGTIELIVMGGVALAFMMMLMIVLTKR